MSSKMGGNRAEMKSLLSTLYYKYEDSTCTDVKPFYDSDHDLQLVLIFKPGKYFQVIWGGSL